MYAEAVRKFSVSTIVAAQGRGTIGVATLLTAAGKYRESIKKKSLP
jgi:hypothetical protein